MAGISVIPCLGEAVPRELFDAGGCAEGSHAWFATLAGTTLASGESAVLVVLREGGQARAALPLVRRRGGWRALTAPYTTRYAPALPDPVSARLLGARARDYVPDVLRLDCLDPSDPGTAAFLEGLGESGLAVARYDHFENWNEEVADFTAYWASRPSRLRTTVRRKLGRALEEGAAFRCYRDDFDEAMAHYEDVHRSSWKSAEPHPRFMPEMVRALGGQGLVRVGVMTLRGRAVAAQIWLTGAGRATIFKLAHREDAAAFSPGTLLTRWMAESLLRGQAPLRVDFGRGGDAYKQSWLTRADRRIGLVAADWRKGAGLAALVREVLPTRLGPALRAATKR